MALMVNQYQTTGIGSLPYGSIEDAIEFSLKHSLPFLPQLPIYDGDMLSQFNSKSSIRDSYRCFDQFFIKVSENPSIKVQLSGPCTLKKYSKINNDLYLLKLERFIEEVSNRHSDPIIFLDEPYLDIQDELLREAINLIKNQKLKVGLHCCSIISNWEEILDSPIDYLSFDTHLLHQINEINLDTLLNNNKYLILGIDIRRSLNTPLLKKLSNLEDSRLLLSPSCGQGKKSIHECEESFSFLSSFKFRNKVE